MNIIIDSKYRIRQDVYQFILEEKVVVTKKESKNFGQESWRTIAFFTKIPHIINYLMKHEINKDVIDSFQKIEDKINQVAEACEKAFKETK